MALTLSDLGTDTGIAALISATGGADSFYNNAIRVNEIKNIVNTALQQNPSLKNITIKILPNLHNAFYNFDKGEIIIGIVEPIALAHEIGHANNIKQNGLYSKILKAALGVSRVNNVAAVPAMLALRTFVKDESQKNDILNALSAVSMATAMPLLTEEASASINALQNSKDTRKAVKTLGPAFLMHLISNMSPIVTYQAGKIK